MVEGELWWSRSSLFWREGPSLANGRAPFPDLLVLPRCPHGALHTGLSCVPPCLLCRLREVLTGPVQLGSRPGSFVTRVGSGGGFPPSLDSALRGTGFSKNESIRVAMKLSEWQQALTFKMRQRCVTCLRVLLNPFSSPRGEVIPILQMQEQTCGIRQTEEASGPLSTPGGGGLCSIRTGSRGKC